MDPITDLYQTMEVTGVVYARLEATAPWGLRRDAKVAEENCHHLGQYASSPAQFAHFGMVSRGSCWLSVEGIPDAFPLAGGDCFLLAPGSSYTLRDNPRTRARSFCEAAPKEGNHVAHYGGGGAPTTVISGWFRFAPMRIRHRTRLLPTLILVKADEAQTLALHATVNLLASEMAEPTPGSELVVTRLADLLFIQCIRAHVRSRSEGCKSGLLKAIFDQQIGVALKSMHDKVAHPWTVASLAAASGMSRSAFALRFKELVGETPLEYLTTWRMEKAAALLQKGDKKLFEVAEAVGYDSDAAFSKAFKRIVGIAPREYRRSAMGASWGILKSPTRRCSIEIEVQRT